MKEVLFSYLHPMALSMETTQGLQINCHQIRRVFPEEKLLEESRTGVVSSVPIAWLMIVANVSTALIDQSLEDLSFGSNDVSTKSAS
jgi:hypothetical protein